ncbi:hypothetical protein L7F22_069244 [Adiantum nelumboides]|nr:hypothetical protein [Adiantum nelumboides]
MIMALVVVMLDCDGGAATRVDGVVVDVYANMGFNGVPNSFENKNWLYDVESVRRSSVEEFYRNNHINQTFSFALDMRDNYLSLNKKVMGIWECCELLNEVVDESDPDLEEPQIEHLLQTAEAIRKAFPQEEWLHLTGLIHDLGKVLLHQDFGGLPQWAVVGDTFPLGCAFDDTIVHSEYFKDNLDYQDPRFNTKNGIYTDGCGLDNLIMSWGHDEYMYQVMKLNKSTLPPQAFFIVRYHSFYSFHNGGAYTRFMNDFDREMMPWLHTFNKYDLYSKSNVLLDVEKVKPYYLSLIAKYFPETLHW